MHSNSTHRSSGRPGSKTSYAPRQERSRATRDRILSVLVRLLDGKAFDQISVAELTAAARCSMSSFYARFPTKDALFSALLDQFFDTSSQLVGGALSRIQPAQTTSKRRARALIEFLLHSYREHRGLLRALADHDRRHPDSGFGSRTRQHKREMSAAMFAMLLDDDIQSVDDPAIESLRFGLWLVVQAIEQIVLFDSQAGKSRIPDDRLVEELTAVLAQRLTHLRVTRTHQSRR